MMDTGESILRKGRKKPGAFLIFLIKLAPGPIGAASL
jgi:hypothetical protein